jgi:hypothetical protein
MIVKRDFLSTSEAMFFLTLIPSRLPNVQVIAYYQYALSARE